MAATQYFEQVQKIFIAFYQRPADPAGLKYWAQRVDAAGGDFGAVIDAFAASPEAIDLYGAIDATTIGTVIDKLYLALFNTTPDAAGKQFYVDGFIAGTFSAGTIALNVLNGAAGDDAVAVANKVQVANNFTQQVDGRPLTDAYFGSGTSFNVTYAGDTDAQAARDILKGVTFNASTVLNPSQVTEQLKAKIADATDPIIGQSGGQTFMLTTGADNLVGTAGNDTFRGDNTTLQATDTVKGGAGTDTFEYTDARTTAVAGDKVPAALVSEVEVINIRNVNGTAGSVGTKEVATFSFADVVVPKGGTGETVIFTIAGRTVTLTGEAAAGADVTFTAANIAAAFAGTASAGITVGGTLAAYTAALGTGNSVVFTAAGFGNQPTNLSAVKTGTSLASVAVPGVVVVEGIDPATSTGANIEVAASNFAGATDFNSVNSLQKVTFTGLSGTQKVGIVGNGSVLNGDVDYTLAGTATATTINVADGTKQGTVTNTGATVAAATINSTGAANTLTGIDLGTGTNVTSLTVNAATNLVGTIANNGLVNLAADYAATAALTVNGAASSVALGNGATANFKTIDASGLTTGGLTIALGTNTTSFKGGQGNDVVTTAVLAATASVDAGAGTADILVANADTDVDTVAKAALYKNFEVLRTAADTSKTYDMSLFTGSTIGAVQVATATSQTITKMTATQAANVTVRGDQGTALTLTLADATGTADVVGLTLSNPTATATAPADVDVVGLSIAGVETLNITSSGGGVDLASAGTLNSLAFASGGANKLKTIAVSGASSLDLSLTNTAVAVAVTSAQTGTGSLKVAGNVIKGSSITTTANKDDITVTAQAAGGASDFITYNAGAGDDAISATVAAINNVDSTKASVKIDGGAGIDTLTITGGGAAMVDANFQFLTGIEKLVVGNDGAVDIKTGGFFDTNFKAAGIELTADVSATNGDLISIDMATFTGNVKATLTNATDSATTITTGAGTDTIKVTNAGTATTDTITVAAGAGNDTININSKATGASGVIVVTGGLGADTINLAETARGTASVHNQATVNIAAGDSTISAFDSISGFRMADGTNLSDTLNFDNVKLAGTQTAAGVTGYTGAELTYTISAAGQLSFVGSKAAALTVADMANFAQTLVTAENGDTVFFKSGSNSYVFNNDTAGDSLVQLVGITELGLTTTAGTTTAGYIYIA